MGSAMKPDTRGLRPHPASGMRAAFTTSLACRRRCPESLHSCAPARRCDFDTRAQVEFMSVDPEVGDQEAELHDLGVQPTSAKRSFRCVADGEHVLASVRAGNCRACTSPAPAVH